MPENSNPDDLSTSEFRSRMTSLGLEATPRKPTPKSGLHIFAGVIAAVLTYLVLAVLLMVLIGGLVGSALQLVALIVAVVVGVRVYRILQRRGVKEEGKE